MWSIQLPKVTMFKKPNINFNADFSKRMPCVKTMLIFANILFLIVGFLLLSVTTTIIAIYREFNTFLNIYFFDPLYLLIGIAIITFLISFFGIVGILKERTLLVNLYSLLLVMMIFFEIIAIVIGFFQQTQIPDKLYEQMYHTKSQYYVSERAQQSWDFLQSHLQCCGINSFTDWKSEKLSQGTEIDILDKNGTLNRFVIPNSCCLTDTCQLAYLRGCLNYLTNVVVRCNEMIQTGAFCIALLQLTAAIFAHKLAKEIRRSKTDRDMQKYNHTPTVDEKPPVLFVQTMEEDN